LLQLGVAIQFFCMTPVKADVISATPSLPLLNVPYISTVGAGCFPTEDACIAAGTLTLTSVVSSMFKLAGQDIVADAVFSGEVTSIGGTGLGQINLSGTLEQEVQGRTFSTETGTWTSELIALALSGRFRGHTLDIGLVGSQDSFGTSSVQPSGDQFSIGSFFDVFVDLTLDSTPPLHTTRGPLHFEAGATVTTIPEPGGWMLSALPLLSLVAAKRRRRG
jgi:hypothetical protein